MAAEWVLPHEPLTVHADALLRGYTEGRVSLVVPDLFFAEFGNVLWKAEQSGRCDARVIDTAIAKMLAHEFRSFKTSPLLGAALQIVRAYRQPVYDSIYIALAVETNSEMISSDQKLVNAAHGESPMAGGGSLAGAIASQDMQPL
ncbi:MAG TPA: type II toxin-antitoxin system VapC family toxin [Bryobacteraceae bacterium]